MSTPNIAGGKASVNAVAAVSGFTWDWFIGIDHGFVLAFVPKALERVQEHGAVRHRRGIVARTRCGRSNADH